MKKASAIAIEITNISWFMLFHQGFIFVPSFSPKQDLRWLTDMYVITAGND